MQSNVITISQLNGYIKGIFDAEELLHNIRISGEISNMSVSGRHAYFVLKEEGAQLPCIFFGFTEHHTLREFSDGDKVILTGSPNFYVKGGKLSFSAYKMEAYGQGDLYQRFLLLKDKLQHEGLFDLKIAMPPSVKRIGVITSPTGAVIQDIIHIAHRRNPGVDILVYPVKVQGEGAADEIVDALFALDKYKKVDVIVVARGGGSIEDLAAFNDESVARAVAACKKFVVSGVGHETDFTLCDFCADLRAPTPSAAAELLTTDIRQQKARLLSSIRALEDGMEDIYDSCSQEIRQSCIRLSGQAYLKIETAANAVKACCYRLNGALTGRYRDSRESISGCLLKLDMLNPARLLANGYSKILHGGKTVSSVKQIAAEDSVKLVLCDGTADAVITQITPTEEQKNVI